MKCFACLLVLIALWSAVSARPRHFKHAWKNGEYPSAKRTFNAAKAGDVGDIWSNCGSSSDMATISGVTIIPDPPQKGKRVIVAANFTLKESITGGSVNIDLKIDSIIHYKKTLDLCEFASENRIQCPIPDMATAVKVTQTLPDVSGHAKGTVTAVDPNGKRIICIHVDIHL